MSPLMGTWMCPSGYSRLHFPWPSPTTTLGHYICHAPPPPQPLPQFATPALHSWLCTPVWPSRLPHRHLLSHALSAARHAPPSAALLPLNHCAPSWLPRSLSAAVHPSTGMCSSVPWPLQLPCPSSTSAHHRIFFYF